jgi:hypothetical protein
MNLPKNIFFYWHDKNLNNELTNNINNYKKSYPDFNVKVIGYDDIILFQEEFSQLIELFKKIKIEACRSDIARILILYRYGGMYIDINTINKPFLNSNKNIYNLFDEYKHFNTSIMRKNNNNYDLGLSIILSYPNSLFLLDFINQITTLLQELYNKEILSDNYVEYNILCLTGSVIACNLLDYKFNSDYRQSLIGDNIYKEEKFIYYKIGVFEPDYYLKMYGCNMNHHHGNNFDKHWSKLQQSNKLFKN